MGWFRQLHYLLNFVDWKTIPDVVLLSLVLFFLYRTFLAAGTYKIAVGLTIAALLFIIAFAFELKGIMWIYSNLSDVLIVLLIVIFQPELRRIFERVASFRRWAASPEQKGLPERIAGAVLEFSRRRWGALLVFPGNESLSPWTAGGEKIDAAVNVTLFLSIFDPSSPGHDGAAIIMEDRISEIGVRLPISSGDDLSGGLGTRHYAAHGLAEKTDALVLAVSEETGVISAFLGPDRQILSSTEEISAVVRKHRQEKATFRLVPRGARRKIGMLLELAASILLAITIWSAITLSEGKVRETTVSSPVEFFSNPRGLIVTTSSTESIKLVVAGTAKNLNGIDRTGIKTRVDLSDIIPGEHTLTVNSGLLELPPGVRLIQARPSEIRFTVRALNERIAFVQPDLTGRPAEDYYLLGTTVTPDRVLVYTAALDERLLDAAGNIQIKTDPVDLTGLKKTTIVRRRLAIPHDLFPSRGEWPEVEIEIRIGDEPPDND